MPTLAFIQNKKTSAWVIIIRFVDYKTNVKWWWLINDHWKFLDGKNLIIFQTEALHNQILVPLFMLIILCNFISQLAVADMRWLILNM